jgi:hypothetical protein
MVVEVGRIARKAVRHFGKGDANAGAARVHLSHRPHKTDDELDYLPL